MSIYSLTQGTQGREYTLIDIGVVELVLAVVIQEVLHGFANEMFIFGISKRAPHQHGSAIPDVAGDDVGGKLVPSKVAQHSIDGVCQVGAGVDQSAIEIKDQQLDSFNRNFAVNFSHVS